MRWVPFEMDERDLRNRVRNKMIRPTTIPQTLTELEAMFDAPPIIAGFDDEVRTVSADALRGEPARRATGEQSNVIEAVRASVDALGEAAPGSVIILVSDGHDRTQTAPDAAIRAARERGVRLVAAAMGGPAGATDYAITAHAEPTRLHIGQRGEVVTRILAPPDAGTVEVALYDLQDRAASPMRRSVTVDATSVEGPVYVDSAGDPDPALGETSDRGFAFAVALPPGSAEASFSHESLSCDVPALGWPAREGGSVRFPVAAGLETTVAVSCAIR